MPTQSGPGTHLTALRCRVQVPAFVCLGLLAVAAAASGGDGNTSQRKTIDFAHDIAPLIKARCAKCHTDGTYKASFSLDTREAMLNSEAVVPGKSGDSEL